MPILLTFYKHLFEQAKNGIDREGDEEVVAKNNDDSNPFSASTAKIESENEGILALLKRGLHRNRLQEYKCDSDFVSAKDWMRDHRDLLLYTFKICASLSCIIGSQIVNLFLLLV